MLPQPHLLDVHRATWRLRVPWYCLDRIVPPLVTALVPSPLGCTVVPQCTAATCQYMAKGDERGQTEVSVALNGVDLVGTRGHPTWFGPLVPWHTGWCTPHQGTAVRAWCCTVPMVSTWHGVTRGTRGDHVALLARATPCIHPMAALGHLHFWTGGQCATHSCPPGHSQGMDAGCHGEREHSMAQPRQPPQHNLVTTALAWAGRGRLYMGSGWELSGKEKHCATVPLCQRGPRGPRMPLGHMVGQTSSIALT